MAVSEQVPYIEHIGNGVTTSFALGFDCDIKDRLVVSLNAAAVYFPDWSFSNGRVVFNVAPKSGDLISIRRQSKFERETNYKSHDNSLSPSAFNKDFDVIWWALQELKLKDKELEDLILREESFLEIVSSTSFAEPNITFGLYTTIRDFKLNPAYPHIAYSDTKQPIKVGIYKNDLLICEINFNENQHDFNFLQNQIIEFKKGDLVKLQLLDFHYSVKNIAVSLIGRFHYYNLYALG
ncbi:hypothetical protein D7V64_02685 [Acinetobacter cumulans]|uniref:Uncharacterized protein n=1 Tax=Acinetobacter cumulans TaxID=2136182 RepID=A0A3A8G9I1_9GAMM|nr:hypothetical protein [Acinetobacter cumulans]RKG55238.1 hypothetical protein D7V64_02685 [Acinetobacter cumulans]